MKYYIYLKLDNGNLHYKWMKPEDTLNYRFILSKDIVKNAPDDFDQDKLEIFNKVEALRCHEKMMKLRLKINTYDAPAAKLLKQNKFYFNVLGSYLDFFEEKPFQLPRFRLDDDKTPKYALDLKSGANIRLTKKQGKALSVFYNHFINSNIGKEWLCFDDVYNMLDENDRNDGWFSITDIFEKKEGKEKINKLFDVKPEGSRRYYRIKTGV